MAIDIGDAVLSVLLDSSQANAQLAAFGGEVPAKLAPAQAALNDATAAVSGMTKEMAVGQQGAVELGTVMNLAGETTRESMYQARGEAGLLGEALGIHLPRHVRSFIAELPGVGAALSAAFQATAVLFIIDAAVQLIEKMVEMAQHGEKVAEAWRKVDEDADTALRHVGDEILKVEAHIAELNGNHMLALQKTLELLGHTSLAGLAKEIQNITKDVDAAFIETKTWWDYITTFGQANAGITSAKNDFDAITKSYRELLKSGDRLGAFAALESGADSSRKKLEELTKEQDNFKAALQATNDQAGSQQIKDQIGALQVQIDGRKQLTKALDDYRKLQEQSNKLEQDQKSVDRTEEQKKELADLSAAEQASLKERLAAIQTEKNEQHLAFEDGKITAQQWSDAQIKATTDSLKAQTDYDAKLVEFAKRESDGHKASVAATNASVDAIDKLNKAFETAANGVDKARQETVKLRAEMEKIAFPLEKTHEQTQAFKELETAEKQLTQAQKTLAEAKISDDTRAIELSIRNLANLRVISKRTEANALAQIDDEEKKRALEVLQQLLDGQLKELDAARKKFQDKSKDALTPPEELAKLKTELDQARIAVDKTQVEMLKLKTTTNDYAKAVALAVVTGKTQLTQQLQENHAALLQNRAELIALKSKKDLTKADQDRIAVLQKLTAAQQKYEKELEHDAKAGLTAWKQFSQGFRDETQKDVQSLEQMGEQTRKDFQEFASDIGTELGLMLKGQESFGQAMENAVKDLVAKLAEHWGKYFIEKGVADLASLNPIGAAEIAGGIALMAVASAMGSGGSSGGSSSSSAQSAGTPAPAANSPGIAAGGQPTSTHNVLHLAEGGLVMKPTLAVVGDAGPEAVIPLRGAAAAGRMGNMGTQTVNNVFYIDGMISPDNLGRVIDQVNQRTKSGRSRLHSTTSDRAIKKT